MKTKLKPRIGLVSIGVPYFEAPAAVEHLLETREYLSQSWQVAGPENIVTDDQALQAIAQTFRTEEEIDVLILQIGTFPEGEAPLKLVEELGVPVIIHALPEPNLETAIALNSLCGANMTTYAFTALGYPHTVLFGDIRNTEVAREMTAHVRGAVALAELNRTRLALVGFRAPGFYPCVFDELLLRKKLDVKLDHITLGTLMLEMQSGERKAAPVNSFPTIEGGELPDEAVMMFERYYAALSKVLDLDSHRVFAIKDWPEVMGLEYPGGIWPVLGWMVDDGCLLAPEGDVNAAVTVALLNSLTGNIPFFADVVAWDDETSAFLLWHYGAAPSLARSQEEIRYGSEGREVQFTIKPGKATFARLGLQNGSFRLLTMAVEVLDKPVAIRRAGAWIKTLENPAGEIMRHILDHGWEHHFILVHGDVRRELEVIARLSGIPITTL
jgi:L-fucose isomerase-like protein